MNNLLFLRLFRPFLFSLILFSQILFPLLGFSIIRGVKIEASEFPEVVKIQVLNYEGDGRSLCSAVAISKRILLTAYHCIPHHISQTTKRSLLLNGFEYDYRTVIYPDEMDLRADSLRGSQSWEMFLSEHHDNDGRVLNQEITDIMTLGTFGVKDKYTRVADFAAIVFDYDINERFLKVETGNVAKGDTVTMVGFGCNEIPTDESSDCGAEIKRKGKNKIKQSLRNLYFYSRFKNIPTGTNHGSFVTLGTGVENWLTYFGSKLEPIASVSYGDSGGALIRFLLRKIGRKKVKIPVLIGITSSISAAKVYGIRFAKSMNSMFGDLTAPSAIYFLQKLKKYDRSFQYNP